MSEQPQQPQQPKQPPQAAQVRRPFPPRQPREPILQCPFCSGSRFDYGRDIYAGTERLMYCRLRPPPGRRPDDDLCLPMKGAVCLDCGYVAMMVDVVQLHAPIRRLKGSPAAGQAPAPELPKTGAAALLAWSVEAAAEALKKMGETAKDSKAVEAPRPAALAAPAEEGAADLATLIERAERAEGLDRKAKP